MTKKPVFFSLILLFFIVPQALAVPLQDTLSTPEEINELISSDTSDFGQKASRSFELQTQLNQQKAYKFLFLAGMIFFALLCVLIFLFFYRKISKIHELTKIHVREIQLRDTRIKNLSLLLTHTAQPMLLMDKQGNLKWMNAAFADYNYFDKKANIEEKNFFYDIATEPDETEEVKKLEESKQVISYTLKTGNKRVERRFIPITESNDEVSGYALVDFIEAEPGYK